MATVTGFTAARMLAIENATIVSGAIDSTGHLILTRKDGATVDAGSVYATFIEIGNAVDLNDLTAAGTYVQSSSGEAATGTNYPVGVAGLLEVKTNGTTMVWQRFTPYGSFGTKFYARTWYNGTWYAWKTYTNDLEAIPAGNVSLTAKSSAPTGWLLCDGSAVSRTTYATLFTAVGTTYGVGDGSTTFNLPNFKGKVAVGLDAAQTEFDALAETGGSKTHTLTAAELASHNHIQDSHNHTQNSHNHTQSSHNHTASSSADGGHLHQPGDLSSSYGFLAFLQSAGVARSAMTRTGSFFAFSSPTQADFDYANATDTAADHTHTITPVAATAVNVAATATNIATTATNQATAAGTAHNNLQPYLVMNYIIKY